MTKEPISQINIQLENAKMLIECFDSATDRPIADARVFADRDYSATTNVSGLVEIPLVVRSGSGWNVTIEHDDYPPCLAYVPWRATHEPPYRIGLVKGASMSLRVLTLDNQPIPDGSTFLYGSFQANTSRRRSKITNGGFVALRVTAGIRYRGWIDVPGFVSRLICFTGAARESPVSVELTRIETWKGEVRDKNGEVVSDCVLRFDQSGTPEALDDGECNRYEAVSIPWLEGARFVYGAVSDGRFETQMPFLNPTITVLERSGNPIGGAVAEGEPAQAGVRTVTVSIR